MQPTTKHCTNCINTSLPREIGLNPFLDKLVVGPRRMAGSDPHKSGNVKENHTHFEQCVFMTNTIVVSMPSRYSEPEMCVSKWPPFGRLIAHT